MKFKCVRQSQHSAYKKIHSIKDIFCDYIRKEERPQISDLIFHIIKLFKKKNKSNQKQTTERKQQSKAEINEFEKREIRENQ